MTPYTLLSRPDHRALLHAMPKVVALAALITLGAKIQVPFWPVPMTMHTLAVLSIAILAGPRLAAGAVADHGRGTGVVLGQFEQFGAEPDARSVALAGGRRMGSRSCWPMLHMDEGLAVSYSTRRSSRPPHALRRAISVPAKDVAHTLSAMSSWEAPDPVALVRSN